MDERFTREEEMLVEKINAKPSGRISKEWDVVYNDRHEASLKGSSHVSHIIFPTKMVSNEAS